MVGSEARHVTPKWQADAVLAERRKAPWLLSSYAEDVITVASSDHPDDTKDIDLRYPLADGRLLTDVPSLCRSVREYLFLVRDDRYGRVQDATTHAHMVSHMLQIVHAMSVREIWSFGELQRSDVNELAEVCVGGIEALTESTRRLGEYLARFTKKSLPPVRLENSGVVLDRLRIVRECNLPSGVARLPRTAHVLDIAANMLGIGSPPDGEICEPRHLTAQNVRMYLAVFESLFDMRHTIEGEGLLFKPFKDGASCRATQLGRETNRTPIPPPKLVLAFLEGAADYLSERGEEILRDGARAASIDAGNAQTRPVGRREQLLACACFVLVQGFSARRTNETLGVVAGCLAGNDEHGWYLHVYISKNLRRMDWIPIPAIVARAVEILIKLSERARQKSEKPELFQMFDEQRGKLTVLKPNLWLNELAAEVGVPLHVDRLGEKTVWKWQSRQLRRFFAVLYFYRYDGQIEVLAHHLRHFNLNLTRAYVTLDPEVAALWHQEEWGYQGHVARAIVAGEKAYSGAMGKRLSMLARWLKDRFRRLLHVAPQEKAADALQTMMARKGLVLTPKKWVLCTCPGTVEGGARAACRAGADDRGGTGPDFANAGPTVCPACPWAMRDSGHDNSAKGAASLLAATVESGTRSNTVFGEIERANLVKLQRFNGTASA